MAVPVNVPDGNGFRTTQTCCTRVCTTHVAVTHHEDDWQSDGFHLPAAALRHAQGGEPQIPAALLKAGPRPPALSPTAWQSKSYDSNSPLTSRGRGGPMTSTRGGNRAVGLTTAK